MTVTAPVLSTPRMPRRFARLRSHAETAAMSCRRTSLVKPGSWANRARRPWGTVSTHCRTRTHKTTRSARAAAKSHMRRPMQLGQNPRRWHENATARDQPQSGHLARTKPCARIPQRRKASTSDATNAGSADESSWESNSERKVRNGLRERHAVEGELTREKPHVIKVLHATVHRAQVDNRLELLGDRGLSRVARERGRGKVEQRRVGDVLRTGRNDVAEPDIDRHCDARLPEQAHEADAHAL